MFSDLSGMATAHWFVEGRLAHNRSDRVSSRVGMFPPFGKESSWGIARAEPAGRRKGSQIAACPPMVFKLALSAQKGWRALNGAKLLADVIEGVAFKDGARKEAA